MRLLLVAFSLTGSLACQRVDRDLREHAKPVEPAVEPAVEPRQPELELVAKAKFEAEMRDRLARLFVAVSDLDAFHDPEVSESADVLEQRRLDILRELERAVGDTTATLADLDAIARSVAQLELDTREIRQGPRNDHSAKR